MACYVHFLTASTLYIYIAHFALSDVRVYGIFTIAYSVQCNILLSRATIIVILQYMRGHTQAAYFHQFLPSIIHVHHRPQVVH